MVIILKNIRDLLIVYTIGATTYSLIEIAFRGFTHWSMTLTSGVALLLIYLTEIKIHNNNFLLRILIGALIITTLEFSVGVIVNLIFNLDVWSYSDRAYNILGQICPWFSFVWVMLCIPITVICSFLRKKFKSL